MKKLFLVRFAAAAVSAFLLWAAFPPHGESMDALFALAPLLLVARTSRPKAAAKWWFAGGFAFWFATLAWLPAIVKNGGPWPLVALGWAGLAAACAGYFALFGALDAFLWRRAGAAPGWKRVVAISLAEPVLWAGIECVRARLFSGFAWNFLGVAAADASFFRPLLLTARFGGVYLVSALVLLVNGVIAAMAERILAPTLGRAPDPRTVPVRLWRIAETALPLLLALGIVAAAAPRGEEHASPFRVALVQRNFPCVFKEKAEDDPLRAYDGLLDAAAAARPDLVVWSESAMAEFGLVRGDNAGRVAEFFARKLGGAALLAGGEDVVAADDGGRREYNAAALYIPRPRTGATNEWDVLVSPALVYHKQHLVPFGEYIPFDKTITWLKRFAPTGVSLYAGTPRLLVLANPLTGRRTLLAPFICYEDTDPRLTRAAAAAGAQVLVLITNDSWFSDSIEPVQHYRQSVLRAVETGLPLVRVGNSGVTGVVRPGGGARLLSDGDGEPLVDAPGCQVETVAVPDAPAPTPYVRLGDAPLLVLFGAVLALLAAAGFRRCDKTA